MRREGCFAGVVAFVVVAGCSRSPAEPSSGTATVEAGSSAAKQSAGGTAASAVSAAPRCIRPWGSPTPTPPPAPAGACPASQDRAPDLAHVTVTFPDATRAPSDAGLLAIDAELAQAPAETARGLMYRTRLAEDRGMLFRLGERRDHTFWMRNTCIPLDMMFIDDDGTIVGIAENVATLSDAETSVGCPSTHVLEVNAGWSRRHGVAPGQKVTLPAP